MVHEFAVKDRAKPLDEHLDLFEDVDQHLMPKTVCSTQAFEQAKSD